LFARKKLNRNGKSKGGEETINLNPEYIEHNLEKVGKQEAIYFLKGWIENSQKSKIRNHSLQILGKIDKDTSFSFYEHLFISDKDLSVRLTAGRVLCENYFHHPDLIPLFRYVVNQDQQIEILLFIMEQLRKKRTYETQRILAGFIREIIKGIESYNNSQLPSTFPLENPQDPITEKAFDLCVNLVLYRYYTKRCNYNATMRNGLIILLNCDGASLRSINEIAKIGQLRHLQYLSLKRNRITSLKGIPDQQDLLKLDLSHNHITKVAHLEGQPDLKELTLAHNQIEKIEDLDAQDRLVKLDLSHNRIRQIQNLNHLKNLKYLNLSHNQIQKINNLDGLTNLKKLNLSFNYITTLENLRGLPNLIWFYVNDNQIEKIKGLEQLEELRGLLLSHNKITKIEGLEELENLRKLELSENKITKIEGLTHNTQLQELYLDKNEITELDGLETLENLIILFLEQNKIQEFNQLKIKNLKTLDRFFLNDNPLSEKSRTAYRNFKNYW
jgi:Leucine-rich repeat (LRR) protein